jgi:uncharacterized membrane protein (UPF0127 family)
MRPLHGLVLVALLAAPACGDDGQGATDATAAPTAAPLSTTLSTTTSTSGASVSAAEAGQPVGFAIGPARVTTGDGTVCDLCVWLASTREQRRQGLMDVTDLGPADGMAFVYAEPSSSAFWMRDTVMPLSIAWFDDAGAFVSAAEMEPCLDGPDDQCPRYPPARPFSTALELPAGEVTALGIGPGSVLEFGVGAGCGG